MKLLKIISIFIAVTAIAYFLYAQTNKRLSAKDAHAGHNHSASETNHVSEKTDNDDAFSGWTDLSEGTEVKKDTNESTEDVIEITEAQQKEINLKLEQASGGYLYQELIVPGEVVLNEDTVIHLVSRVPGITLSVAKNLGDQVKKGEVMAVLDSAELTEAKSRYYELYTEVGCCMIDLERAITIEKNTKRAINDLLKLPSLKELKGNKYGDMGRFRTELLATYSTFITSKNDYERHKKLYAKGVVSETTYFHERNRLDKAEASFYTKLDDARFQIKQDLSEAQQLQRVTEFKLKTAKRRLMIFGLSQQQIFNLHNAVKEPVLSKTIAQTNSKAILASSKHDCADPDCAGCKSDSLLKAPKILKEADEAFSQYLITAPQNGTVISKHISHGERVTSETEIFTIADLSKVWVNLKVAARDIGLINKNMQVTVSAGGGLTAKAKVELIAPTVNEVTRTAIVRLVIDNHNRQWKPGMFVTGHIRQSSTQTGIVLPAEAVQNIEGKNFIFVPAGYGFKPVPVVIGKRNRKSVQIISGIKQGEVYVGRGAFDLKAIKVTSGQGSHAGHNH